MAAPPEPAKSPPPTQSDGTVLPFPDRFHAAVNFVVNPPPGAASLKDETRLVLYALHQQAVIGPCKEPKPWTWNVVESAKWNSWSQLKDMSSVEAMRLYVKVLEEEVQPDWWLISRSADLQKDAPASTAAQGSKKQRSLRDSAVPGSWATAEVGGPKRPPPRYEHAVALVRRTLYVIGGNCGGRYLNDIWSLDLESLTWQQLSTSAAPVEAIGGGTAIDPPSKSDAPLLPPAFQPIAGHALVVWGASILCIGGHTKSKAPGQRMVVRVLDTSSNVWSLLKPSGEAPPNRGSHTATVIGNRIYVFGGEDRARRAVGDLYILDLTSLAWSTPSTTGTPSARSAHVAAAIDDRFLLIFGGGSVAHCYNDLWVLDTETETWSNPQPEGTPPTPRAGHAGDVLGSRWYIAGGGNNSAGCSDLVALDLSGLGGTPLVSTPSLRWEAVAESESRAPIASEGLSVTSLPTLGLLLAFGGYNGKYHNAVQIYRPDSGGAASSQQARAEIASIAKNRSTGSQNTGQTKATIEPLLGKKPSGETPTPETVQATAAAAAPDLANGHTPVQSGAATTTGVADNRIASLEAVARDAAASREAMLSEMVLMRKQLNRALEAKAAVDKELEAAKRQLSAEQNKVFKLEVELAEAQQKLQQVTDLKKELAYYRKMIEEAEESKGKGSLWKYISGAQ